MNAKSDGSLFVFRSGKTFLILLVYVDDILINENDQVNMKKTIENLKTHFTLKNLGSLNYLLGFEPHQTKSAIYQTKVRLDDSDPFKQPILYQSIIGALQCLTPKRPDIICCVNICKTNN